MPDPKRLYQNSSGRNDRQRLQRIRSTVPAFYVVESIDGRVDHIRSHYGVYHD